MPNLFVVNPRTIDWFINAPRGPVARRLRLIATETETQAIHFARRELGNDFRDRPRTGHLRRSFRVRNVRNSSTYRVSNIAKYFRPLELGSKPHVIRARNVRYLQFRGRDGRWRKIKFVRHPGNRAYMILQRSLYVVALRRLTNVRKLPSTFIP